MGKSATDRSPLAGTRVIDLTRILAGPFATMMLADLGADVIKIERPEGGDETRAWGPPFLEDTATYFLSVNRDKRSVTLDLGRSRGREILFALLARADVLVSNFRPDVMQRLGLGAEEIAARFPRLIDARIDGFGLEPESRGRPAFDLIVQAESGLMDVTGWPDGEPTKAGVSIADEVAGLFLIQGVLAALLRRARDGHGGRVDVSLFDSMLSALTYQAQASLSAGGTPRRRGNAHPSLVPYRPFATADGQIVVGVASDTIWRRFCAAVGLEQLADDPRFATNEMRVHNRRELEERVGRRLADAPSETWRRRLQAAGVPCGRVRTVREALAAPEARERGVVATVAGDREIEVVATALRFDGCRRAPRRPPPRLGEHTEEVLAEIGIGGSELAALRERGIV